jgi:hypothetical protein
VSRSRQPSCNHRRCNLPAGNTASRLHIRDKRALAAPTNTEEEVHPAEIRLAEHEAAQRNGWRALTAEPGLAGTRAAALTPSQRCVLMKLADHLGSEYLRGSDVRVAQNLEKLGFTLVEDYGGVPGAGRAFNDERWFVKLTPLGTETALLLLANAPTGALL